MLVQEYIFTQIVVHRIAKLLIRAAFIKGPRFCVPFGRAVSFWQDSHAESFLVEAVLRIDRICWVVIQGDSVVDVIGSDLRLV